MKHLPFPLIILFFLLSACSGEEASQYRRTSAQFLDSLGGSGVSSQQWWRTAVTLKINVATDAPVKLWLLATQNGKTLLCDYKALQGSGTVTMTAPQGQGNVLTLSYEYKEEVSSQNVILSGKPEEMLYLNTTPKTRTRAGIPASLSGRSVKGNAKYYQFSNSQMSDYHALMRLNEERADAKNTLGLNCNYELKSHGPFTITWVTGREGDQKSRILGYYYHSEHTWDDIKYVDLSETHRWDYIDGLSKVQYQIDIENEVDGYTFKPYTWYDANFDMSDEFGATSCYNMDRVGDQAYNMQALHDFYQDHVYSLRGISFDIDVPEGMLVGFYLRSDQEPYPQQWQIMEELGIKPYTTQSQFKGTCFCVEAFNVYGNGLGYHRSFIKDYDEVIWMGMEDLVEGGDHDCNDVIFGVASELEIYMPEIVEPNLNPTQPVDPQPVDPQPVDPEPVDPGPVVDDATPFPWTIAYEDVNRDPDFDFNDAVIKLIPDYENERCCIMVMAAGSTTRMYLHYDGPDGDRNLGEIHDLMGSRSLSYINTKEAVAGTPFAQIDCVPWPRGYTMAEDAKRFYIEIQRGTCDDCTDVITLAYEPGQMPEALLVAGEWEWPKEGTHIFSTYSDFPGWAQDVTKTRFWEWYMMPNYDTYVAY